MWHHMISHKRKRARPNKITQNITSHYVHSRITVDKGLSNMWSHWECLQLGISYIHLLSIIRNIIKVLYVIITISVKYISSQILKTMGYIMNVIQIMNLYQESAINFLILALTPFQYKMLTSSVKMLFPIFVIAIYLSMLKWWIHIKTQPYVQVTPNRQVQTLCFQSEGTGPSYTGWLATGWQLPDTRENVHSSTS